MSRLREGRFRCGTSGYQYPHWRGVFYPADLPPSKWFSHYARVFDTVEINNTFYRLPPAEVFERWRAAAPPGFLYALKFSRFGTHVKRLRDPAPVLENFLDRASRLEEHLGPILVQLPPNWKARPERLEGFFEAAAGAPVRWVVEFRDPSWLSEEVFRILERHGAALCIHDLLEDHPRRRTADWVYLRYHGVNYGGRYGPARLAREAAEIVEWLRAGIDVFAYFNNDREGWAVKDARDLRRFVGTRLRPGVRTPR
ncbi:MAG: hypothetical protein KatS3mg076_2733 [Candidatus Binatia bacterium]|nr:MAG: hypothetical protein KatS3mg076_2733 [Candidatus Binatia bacterium]